MSDKLPLAYDPKSFKGLTYHDAVPAWRMAAIRRTCGCRCRDRYSKTSIAFNKHIELTLVRILRKGET